MSGIKRNQPNDAWDDSWAVEKPDNAQPDVTILPGFVAVRQTITPTEPVAKGWS